MSISNIDMSMLFSAALEGFADGQKRQELEYTIYGKLEDFAVLQSAQKSEEQEQFSIPLEHESVGMRIRRINGSKFVQTVKVKREGVKGKEEVESEISEDMYSVLREGASDGYRKKRYFFPVEGSDLVWEVDVFEDLAGQQHPWVKLDMEVPSEDTPPPALPFELPEKIVAQGDHKSSEEKDQIDRLWTVEWNNLQDRPTIIKPTDPAGAAAEEPVPNAEDTAGPLDEPEEHVEDPSMSRT